MRERYEVYIDGKKVYSNLSEEEYFDLMEDYAKGFYENKNPSPNSISYKIIKEH